MSFVHLHVHSYYSFLDSTLSPVDIVTTAKTAGAEAVAITDINCMSGVIEFIKAANAAGVRPIIGAEMRQPYPAERKLLRNRKSVGGIPPLLEESPDIVCDKFPPDMEDRPGWKAEFQSASPALCHGDPDQRAVLLAKNFEGYSEISRIATRRMLDGEFDLYRELRCLSANVITLTDSIDVLKAMAVGPASVASPYAILIPSRRRRRQNRGVYECALALSLPMVITCDVKLATPEDVPFHTLMQAMRRLSTVHHITPQERMDPAQHFQLAGAICAFFGLDAEQAHDDAGGLRSVVAQAFANSARIADQCRCELPLGIWKFPRLTDTPIAPPKMLRELVYTGLVWRYGDPLPADVIKRADYELSVIDSNQFTDYFLLVERIVARARSRHFFIVGRGSAANSIVSYSLGITNVCPIKHDLYFERFLNPERSVPPDIDIDFSWKERDEIIQWCFEFFGQDHVALISTIQTFRSRQSIREVAKANGISESEVTQFSKLRETGYCMEEGTGARRGSGRKVHDLSKTEPWRTILSLATRLEGFPRHFSVHCGGIVITPDPVTDWVPLTRSAKGYAVTQYDMYSAEDLGLIKIDLLGNRSLGVLKDAITQAEKNRERRPSERACHHADETKTSECNENGLSSQRGTINTQTFQREAVRMKMAGTRRGTTVALAGVLQNFSDANNNTPALSADATVEEQAFNFAHVTSDANTHAMINEGRTMGCFYIESPGMRALFERLRCDSYEEVVAASSIIRPGVAESGMMQEYISRHKAGPGTRQKSIMVMPLMQQILPETHGVMVYQEDVLRVAHQVAGLSYGQADLLRRAMSGKHRSEEGIAKLEGDFIAGAVANGIDEKDAQEIWRQIASFAGYSFCKGHSAAFAVLSYQIAYLKAHFPAEFFAGLLTNQGGFYGAGAYLQEARRWGVEIQGPCVNRSENDYTGFPGERTSEERACPQDEVAGSSSAPAAPKGEQGHLRVGLLAIQNLSINSREKILHERRRGPYTSLTDLLQRTAIGTEECRTLIKAGALDFLANLSDSNNGDKDGKNYASYDRPAMLLQLATFTKQTAILTDSLLAANVFFQSFSFREKPGTALCGQQTPTPFTLQELCAYEIETLGFPLSAHPLDLIKVPPDVKPACDIRLYDKQRIRMAGLCIAAKILTARNCNKPMKMLTLEDKTDTFEAILFPRIYERFAPRTLGRGPYLVEGLVDMSLGSPTLNVEKIDNRFL